MRITNNIITRNTKTNINGNKIGVDRYNNQMTTQKKISKASEDPVVAIRSLRYSTTLSKLTQYSNNNIPDAQSWLDVTQTALSNMKDVLKDVRSLCVSGSTDTKNEDDRQTILNQLVQLKAQVYEEGNADYGGRTVFSGYRTTSRLTFDADSTQVYDINEHFTFEDFEEKRYYYGDVNVPLNIEAEAIKKTDVSYNDGAKDVDVAEFHRLRLAYNNVQAVGKDAGEAVETDPLDIKVTVTEPTADGKLTTTDKSLTDVYTSANIKVFESEQAWKNADWDEEGATKVGENDVVILRDTGEIVFGVQIYRDLMKDEAKFTIGYEKAGFESGSLKPEFFYRCDDVTDKVADPDSVIKYNQVADGTPAERINAQGIELQDINYTIAANTTLTINTQAGDVFDNDIGRDMEEMINIVQKSINAHGKVAQIKKMMSEVRYQDLGGDTHYQENLQLYLDAAQKEADYADDNLQKTYERYITHFDKYLENTNIAIANVGSTIDRLEMTQTRVENQKYTVEQLKTKNEDRDLSDIIIDYYAAYNAYTASLTAAGKIGEQTLLNYL